jgi:hypothetical protein
MKFEFSWHISEKYSNLKFHEIRPLGAELFHVDGRTEGHTDLMTLIVAFRNFVYAPKNEAVPYVRTTQYIGTQKLYWEIQRVYGNYDKQIEVSKPAISAYNTAIHKACMFNLATTLHKNVKHSSH